ncbi:MAG: hypothetical protein Q9M91_06640 [Candidatus Dojkabacteria bacterium]|nr:hypothetical protein [Candidatus Dojkabacteria bacterium]MDQ7021473.1 hypothetical protein [Candidatus Dojkabacteria bacterium]
MNDYHKLKLEKLNSILKSSEEILLTTHPNIDIDAAASILLFKSIIENHYKNIKKIDIKVLKPLSKHVKYIEELSEIEKYIVEDKNDLKLKTYDSIFVIDAADLLNCFASINIDELNDTRIVVIDHHDQTPLHKLDLYINDLAPAATQQIYLDFREVLNKDLVITELQAKLIQIGIISDSAGLITERVNKNTYKIMAEFRDFANVDPQGIVINSYMIPREANEFFINFVGNLKYRDGFCYTYISDELAEVKNEEGINLARRYFTDVYLKPLEGVNWGFVVRNSSSERFNDTSKKWYVSFRTLHGNKDVKEIAEEFNGGGHTLAAACYVEAPSSLKAVDTVLNVIKKLDAR